MFQVQTEYIAGGREINCISLILYSLLSYNLFLYVAYLRSSAVCSLSVASIQCFFPVHSERCACQSRFETVTFPVF